ncbi:hypothetical protein SERLADRAFT_460120, partial [Serpula lacrymans var. lacrymans S7.9]
MHPHKGLEVHASWEIANILQITRFCQLSAAVVALYDHALLMQREMDLIWRRQWSLITFLYVVIRYAGDVVLVAGAVSLRCQMHGIFCIFTPMGIQLQIWGSLVFLLAMQATFILRVYAMYRQSKKIIFFLSFLLLVEGIIGSIIIGTGSHYHGPVKIVSEPIPGVHMCSLKGIESTETVGPYTTIIGFECIIFALTAWA